MFDKFKLARLQTAVSSLDVFSVISVHKLESEFVRNDLEGHGAFTGSLKVTQG